MGDRICDRKRPAEGERLVSYTLKRRRRLPDHLEFVEIEEIERGQVTVSCRRKRKPEETLVRHE